jgi:hypothetical protein
LEIGSAFIFAVGDMTAGENWWTGAEGQISKPGMQTF